MIDRALANLNASQQDTYYFQLYPLNLTIVGKDSIAPPSGTTYRFTVSKGQQKFDETKLPIEANFKKVNGVQVMLMPKCSLNFSVASFNKNRKVQFLLKLYQTQNNQEYDIGEYNINVEPYVTQFRENRTVRYQHKSSFSEDYQLEFQVYVERSRFALEKVVKDFKVERGLKSPLRDRKEETVTPNMRKVLTGPLSRRTQSVVSQSPVGEYPNVDTEGKESKEATEVQSNNQQLKESQSIYSSGLRGNNIASNRASLTSEEGKTVSRVVQSQIKTDRVSPFESKVDRTIKQTKSGLKSKDSQSSFLEQKPVKKETKVEVKSNKKEQQNDKYSQDGVSERKVPSVSVPFKNVVKPYAKAQIKLAESHRLGTSVAAEISEVQVAPVKSVQSEDWKQQTGLIVFLVISVILIFFAMHPSRKL